MIKSFLLISVLVVMGQTQRPPYAGSANRYPQVLTRFQDELTSTTTTTTPGPATSAVVDRLGEESSASSTTAAPGGVPTSSSPAPTSTSTDSDAIRYPSEGLPVLSLGDAELVERIKTWPREKQPWWYINRVAIDEHLHPSTQTNVLRPESAVRPSFAG